MAIYDLSSEFRSLDDGIDTLGRSLQTADRNAQLAALGAKLQDGDYDGAAGLAFRMGDVQTGLALQQRKQQAASLAALQQGLAASLGGGAGSGAAQDAGAAGGVTTNGPVTGTSQGGAALDAGASDGSGGPARAATAFFIRQGYPPLAAAALAAGFKTESGFDPRAVAVADGRDGSDAVNIGQWNGERAKALQLYAAQNNLDPTAVGTGLGFANDELNGKESRARAALMAASTPEEATAAATSYFRPKGWTPQNPYAADSFGQRLAALRDIIGAPQGGRATPRPAARIDAFQEDNPSDVEDPVTAADGSIRIATDAQGRAWAKAHAGEYGLVPDPQDETRFLPAEAAGALPQADAARQAAIARLPPAAANSVTAGHTAGAPGSQQRLAQLLRLQMLAGATGNAGAAEAIKSLIEIEKQALAPTTSQRDYAYYASQERQAGRTPLSFGDWNDDGKRATSYRTLIDPAERQAAGIAPGDAGIYQRDSRGRLIAVTGGRRAAAAPAAVTALPGSLGPQAGQAVAAGGPVQAQQQAVAQQAEMTPESLAALKALLAKRNGLVEGTPDHRRFMLTGQMPKNLASDDDAATAPDASILIPDNRLPSLSPVEASRLPRGTHFIGSDGVRRVVR